MANILAVFMLSAIVIEIVLTRGFLLVIHGVTDKMHWLDLHLSLWSGADLNSPDQIPVTNTLLTRREHRGGYFPGWLGIAAAVVILVMPIIGGILGGVLYRTLLKSAINLLQARHCRAFSFFSLYSSGDLGSAVTLFSFCKDHVVHVFGITHSTACLVEGLIFRQPSAPNLSRLLSWIVTLFSFGMSLPSPIIWPATCWRSRALRRSAWSCIMLCNIAALMWLEQKMPWQNNHREKLLASPWLESLQPCGVVLVGFLIGLSGLSFYNMPPKPANIR